MRIWGNPLAGVSLLDGRFRRVTAIVELMGVFVLLQLVELTGVFVLPQLVEPVGYEFAYL